MASERLITYRDAYIDATTGDEGRENLEKEWAEYTIDSYLVYVSIAKTIIERDDVDAFIELESFEITQPLPTVEHEELVRYAVRQGSPKTLKRLLTINSNVEIDPLEDISPETCNTDIVKVLNRAGRIGKGRDRAIILNKCMTPETYQELARGLSSKEIETLRTELLQQYAYYPYNMLVAAVLPTSAQEWASILPGLAIHKDGMYITDAVESLATEERPYDKIYQIPAHIYPENRDFRIAGRDIFGVLEKARSEANDYVNSENVKLLQEYIDELKERKRRSRERVKPQPRAGHPVAVVPRPQVDAPAKSKLLAQGTYGCAYMPPLCVDTGDPEYAVGKLTYPGAVVTELAASKHIQYLPGYEKYFGVLTGNSCKPEITEEIKDQCKVAGKFPTVMVSYSSPYLGKSFNKYIEANPVLDEQFYYKKLSYLLMGLFLLEAIDIVHFDVKMDNILVDDKGVCRFIDFGLTVIDPRRVLADHPEKLDSFPSSFYSIYPCWYNAWLDQVNGNFKKFADASELNPDEVSISEYYDQYEKYASFYSPKYVKWTATDPIKRILIDSFSKDYFKRVVKPNVFKVDVYSLVHEIRRYIEYSKGKPGYQNLPTARGVCLAGLINSCLQLNANAVPSAEDALRLLCNCAKY